MIFSPRLRLALSLTLFSLWLAALYAGLVGRGAVHLLLLGGLSLFAWRQAQGGPSEPENRPDRDR